MVPTRVVSALMSTLTNTRSPAKGTAWARPVISQRCPVNSITPSRRSSAGSNPEFPRSAQISMASISVPGWASPRFTTSMRSRTSGSYPLGGRVTSSARPRTLPAVRFRLETVLTEIWAADMPSTENPPGGTRGHAPCSRTEREKTRSLGAPSRRSRTSPSRAFNEAPPRIASATDWAAGNRRTKPEK
jgi:hypothetical protein